MSHGVDLLAAGLSEAGDPVLVMACDCGQVTELHIELCGRCAAGTVEFAWTCERCLSPHWLTVGRQETVVERPESPEEAR